MKLRLIIVSTENGELEHVIFSDDTKVRAQDYCRPGQTVDYDGIIDADLPSGFPIDHMLRRE